ncbi:S-layer homology domain-containing protein [Chengkuizengella axinellae]|uniref:S-layer homology domain-containing protein n=1 Tax=Chengkuizengella axinellae TaxID=3064388 RepID=A0ABT9IZB8_9BACL|nr:S-layer homology domain-containing protein [Chengkuizengella sp. 2205SS18-9]MDP5274703.1 S-layer homology domain-containing protein [Chengkuizengella sp. 2205SS18-9]
MRTISNRYILLPLLSFLLIFSSVVPLVHVQAEEDIVEGFEIQVPEGYEIYHFSGEINLLDSEQDNVFWSIEEFSNLKTGLNDDTNYILNITIKLKNNEGNKINYLFREKLKGNEIKILNNVNVSRDEVNQLQIQMNPDFNNELISVVVLDSDEYTVVVDNYDFNNESKVELWLPSDLDNFLVKYEGNDDSNEISDAFYIVKEINNRNIGSNTTITFDEEIDNLVDVVFDRDFPYIHIIDYGRSGGTFRNVDRVSITPGVRFVAVELDQNLWSTDFIDFQSQTELSFSNDINLEVDVNYNYSKQTLLLKNILQSGDFELDWADSQNISHSFTLQNKDTNELVEVKEEWRSHLFIDDIELSPGNYIYDVEVDFGGQLMQQSVEFTIDNDEVEAIEINLPNGFEQYEVFLKSGMLYSSYEDQLIRTEFRSFDEFNDIRAELIDTDENWLQMAFELKNDDDIIVYLYRAKLTRDEVLGLTEITVGETELTELQIESLDELMNDKITFFPDQVFLFTTQINDSGATLWLPSDIFNVELRYLALKEIEEDNYRRVMLSKEINMNELQTPIITFDHELEEAVEVSFYRNDQPLDIKFLNVDNHVSSEITFSNENIILMTPDYVRFSIVERQEEYYWEWYKRIDIVEDTQLYSTDLTEIGLYFANLSDKVKIEHKIRGGQLNLQNVVHKHNGESAITSLIEVKNANKEIVFTDELNFENPNGVFYEIPYDSLPSGNYEYNVTIHVPGHEPLIESAWFQLDTEDNDEDNEPENGGSDGGTSGGGSPSGGGDSPSGGGSAPPPADDEETESTEQEESEEESDDPKSVEVDASKDAKTEEQADGSTKTKFELDEQTINEALDDVDEVEQLVIDLSNVETDGLDIELSSDIIDSVTDKNDETVIEIVMDEAAYRLPIEEIDLKDISEKLGVSADELKVSIQINKVKDTELTEDQNELDLESDVYDFHFEVTSGDETLEVEQFGQYVERVIVGEKRFDPIRSIAVRLNEDGTFSPIPTIFDGNEAIIKSNSNSKYVIVENKVSFEDSEGWYKTTVEKLASKYIVNGVSETEFAPNDVTTRAQLAAMLVRSLDLKSNNDYSSTFIDVEGNEWFVDELNAAVEAGIILGYEDNTFKPNDLITREQAAAMIYRAMELVQYDKSKLNENLVAKNQFADYDAVSDWAKDELEVMTQAGIIGGKTENTIEPSANATRAEVAVMIARFLQFVGFMN